MATFVLVHGSYGGSWIWKKVTPLLRSGGYEVYTPGLTGLSDRSHLLKCGVDLRTHILDISSLLFYEDLSDVVLVGHSYAGMVITGVATSLPERIKLLVYLDAYVPKDGQSESELWTPEMRDAMEADVAAGRGLRQPPPPAFMGITDPALADWVNARWTPQPITTYTQPMPDSNESSAALRRVYIHCIGGPATTTSLFAPFAAEARASGWKVYELSAGHAVMLTAPHEVAALLLQIAEQADD